ncbi:Retrovirus-related Pol polyprotein from transposon 17.6,Retrovirus-related Pol polyprotein from transposon 297 [Mytilus edulis]|uniref:Retrovirus-related Pol polyprotein from transposon 17.6,Retrovirus-related Pol polyprotein from transposon 297 n=1 Tax=Mytilus edulis TaxID=6550 RepID=A0A8S3Q8Z2_MYTED|nr:Retrovirus-related Pol polyprotein from transposon 17.6,Retrovirus-related Pol polyprotein from transposon 297 [Mytilus edulis]
MGSFYRRFVKNYADIVRPMTDLTKKGKKFVWTDQCETAFHRIKQELTGANIMGHPNNADEFILDVDASGTGIGAVLQQVQEGRERVIAYASRSLNRAERNYCITQQELLAVRYFVDYFRQYLLGRKFKIRSDHQALIWLFRLKEPRGRIARWIEVLSAYNFSIEYRAGKKWVMQMHLAAVIIHMTTRNTKPNSGREISQYKDIGKKAELREVINCDGQELIAEGKHMMQNSARGVQTRNQAQKDKRDTADLKTAKTNIENWPTVCNTTLAKAQQEDQYFKPIYEGLKADKRPTKEEMVISSPETRHYWIIWDTLCLINDVIIRKFSKMDGTGDYYQCLVPKQLRKNIIFQAHDCILSGHLGKTKGTIRVAVDGAPLDCLATDILGPLPTTPRNNKYVLVVTDHFTKWVEIFPVPNHNAETCASVILNEVIARFGSPLSIHSDQGRNYESNIFKELCRMLEVRKTRTSSKTQKAKQ